MQCLINPMARLIGLDCARETLSGYPVRWVLYLFPVLLLNPLIAREEDKKAKNHALESLQGGWQLTGQEIDGKPNEQLGYSYWIVIKGDKLYYGGEEVARLTIDATANPPSIDMAFRNPDRAYEGVYSIEKDTLKICLNKITEGAKERPNALSTEGKSDWRLMTFKQDKNREAADLEGLSGFVGLMIQKVDDTDQIRIAGLLNNSPAKKSELKIGDLLLKVADEEVGDLQGSVKLIRAAKPGTDLKLRIKRGEKEMDVKVKVGVVPFDLLLN